MTDFQIQLLALFGCTLSVVFAFGFEHRKEGVMCAMVLLANFVFCLWVAMPFAPQVILGRFGLHFKGTDLWAFVDMLAGTCYIMIAFMRPWGWLLWIISISQEIMHYYQGDYYLETLDILLAVQIAVFIVNGGRGVRDYLHNRFVMGSGVSLRLGQMHNFSRSKQSNRTAD